MTLDGIPQEDAHPTSDDGDYTVRHLVGRLIGWTAASIHALEGITEIRLAGGIDGSPAWMTARAVLYATGAPPETAPSRGAQLAASDGVVILGSWSLRRGEIVAGQMLDSAIVTVPAPVADPVAAPSAAAERILSAGELVWPPVSDLEPRWRGLDLLAGVTRHALAAPSLVVSVAEDDHRDGTRRWDTFVTPDVAVETQRCGDPAEAMAVSWFPLGDVISRVLERAGLSGLDQGPEGPGRRVEVRTTFLAEEGLSVGALSWTAGEGPELLTEDGPRTPAAITAEVLGLLPRAGKEVERIE